MAERKVPNFLSKHFHSLDTLEEKRRLLDDFDIWKSSVITKNAILSIESELQKLEKEDEEKTDWLSVFHWKYKSAHNKGKRTALRSLLKIFK